MPIWKWSKTAASNGSADVTINYAEGQPPASLNDSSRALMARIKEWVDDVSGVLQTTGGPNAYVVTTNENFNQLSATAPPDGARIAFRINATNAAVATIAVDGFAAAPLRSAPSVEIGAGVLVSGTPYAAVYNASTIEWLLENFFGNPFNIPVGGLLPYVGATAPNANFALPFGQAISRTTYSVLFGITGTTFGSGDGVTTFNIPDLRGRAIFGLDNMGGSAASRITVAGGNYDGTSLGQPGGAQNHTLTVSEMPSHAHPGSTASVNDPGHVHPIPGNLGNYTRTGASNAMEANQAQNINSGAAATGITVTPNIAAQGGGAAHTILPPSMVLPFILRII